MTLLITGVGLGEIADLERSLDVDRLLELNGAGMAVTLRLTLCEVCLLLFHSFLAGL